MDWIKVRMKGSRQVQDMVPAVARELIASGVAERYNPEQPPVIVGRPTIESAVLQPPQENAMLGQVKFHVGPRSPRPRA